MKPAKLAIANPTIASMLPSIITATKPYRGRAKQSEAIATAVKDLAATNKLVGLVLDLRYTDGEGRLALRDSRIATGSA